jgi:ATP-dependent helicase STH1/SNF2
MMLQRSILEADQEEENEEAGDMNDEELNELIARHEHEGAIFREVDKKREDEVAEAWRKAGNRGKPPPPLMQLEELPECYQNDEPFELAETDILEEGRGQRRRNTVIYNDGLSDDAWAQALEEGEDIQELAERAKDRKERRAANKLLKEESGRNTPASDIVTGGRKKKGKAKANDYEGATGSKRKRGYKANVTPDSDDDDDDDDHEVVSSYYSFSHCATY